MNDVILCSPAQFKSHLTGTAWEMMSSQFLSTQFKHDVILALQRKYYCDICAAVVLLRPYKSTLHNWHQMNMYYTRFSNPRYFLSVWYQQSKLQKFETISDFCANTASFIISLVYCFALEFTLFTAILG